MRINREIIQAEFCKTTQDTVLQYNTVMPKVSVSFRTDQKKVKQLDSLAKRQRRDRTQLIDEAIGNYIEIQQWQLREIEAGIRAADAGEFASDEEVRAEFARWRK